MNRRNIITTLLSMLGLGALAQGQVTLITPELSVPPECSPGSLRGDTPNPYRNGFCPVCHTQARAAPKSVKKSSHHHGLDWEPIYYHAEIEEVSKFNYEPVMHWYADFCAHCGVLYKVKV